MNIMPCGWEHEDDDEFEAKKIKATARRIFKRILADLTDRRELRQEWERIDRDVKAEIRNKWLGIIEEEITP